MENVGENVGTHTRKYDRTIFGCVAINGHKIIESVYNENVDETTMTTTTTTTEA